jgi:hypothetical protein
MTQTPKNSEYARQLDAYERLVATNPEVERKGASVPYTSVDGNMFSYLSKSGTLALRLPEGVRDSFLSVYKAKLCDQYGVVQKEYVEVPDRLLHDTLTLREYFEVSYAYVRGLKAKATTRGSKAKKAEKGAKAAAKGRVARPAKKSAKKRR